MTKLRDYDNLGTTRFITYSCYHRFQLLAKVGWVHRLSGSECRTRQKIRIETHLKEVGYPAVQ